MAQKQNSQTVSVCTQIRQWIADLRSDLYAALSLDWLISLVNDSEVAVTKDDVKTCLKYDDTVKIIDANGREVLWLWGGSYLYDFVDKVADLASKYGEAMVIAEV